MHLVRSTIHRRTLAALALFWVIAYLLPLPMRPLMRPDEFRYGEIPREMLATGDWVAPRFVNFRYFEKPALGYQIHALSMKIFGQNAFALRFPSAFAVLLTGLMIYFLIARKSRDPWLPALTVLICWGFGLVLGIGTFVVLDSLLCMALTLCLTAFYCAYDAKGRAAAAGFLALAGVGAGAAFLIKGFLAFAVPVVAIGPFLLWRREWRKLFTMPWIPLVTALAVAAPWSWAIWRAEPDFWNYFVIEEHWKRFTASTYDRDPQPFWYFLPVLLGGMLPSGLLVVGAWRSWRWNFFRKPLMRYALCWFLLPFLFFSASSCKLGTYILPCFPPLAILIAAGLRRALLTDFARCRRTLGAVLGWFGLVLAVAAVLGAVVITVWRLVPKLPEIYEARNLAPYALALVLMLYGMALWRRRRSHPRILLAVFLLGAAPAVLPGMNSIPAGALAGGKTPERGIREGLAKLSLRVDDVFAAENSGLGAVAWCLKRTDLMLMNGKGEFRYAIEHYPEEYRERLFRENEMKALLKSIRPRRLVLIILRDLDDKALPRKGPKPEQVVSGHGVTVAIY